jgi:DNA topoisomerase-3
LDVAQKLYEIHKVATYPRSDSKYLPNSIYKDEAPKILKNLEGMSDVIGKAAQGADKGLKSAAWNDSKVSDHHAIIPTTEATPSKISSLTGIDRKVFDLIAKTFIAQFYPDQKWQSLSAQVQIKNDKFKATGRNEIDAGWRSIYSVEKVEKDSDSEEDSQSLPVMNKGDEVSVDLGSVQSKRTTPPSHFTDGTLIAAMTQIHKFVSDSETKKRLKENDGLGTEATRDNILETLIRRNFFKRKGKNQLVSTDTGQSVILALPNDVTDPGMTAIWEGYLEKVSKGELELTKFMEVQIKNVSQRVSDGKSVSIQIKGAKTIQPIDGHGQKCPKCDKGIMITRVIHRGEHKGKKFLSCDQYPDCESVIWPGLKIDPISGHGEKCTKCGVGTMLTREVRKGDHKGKKFLSCDQYRATGCSNSIWPKPKIKPADGHGEDCPECSDGKMETRKSKKGTIFLGCNKYPECKGVKWLNS